MAQFPVANPGTIGLMGFTSQIVGISFPAACDVLVIQANVIRNAQSGGDTLVRANGIDACHLSTGNLAGYANGWNNTQVVPLGSGATNGAAQDQKNVNLLIGPKPVPPTHGAFVSGFTTGTLAWSYPNPCQVDFTFDGGAHYNYGVRGYTFINLSVLAKTFPGLETLSFSMLFGGSTYSQYGLAVEAFSKIRGLAVGGSITAQGGVTLEPGTTMGFQANNMTNWRRGIGTPAGSGSLAGLTPTISCTVAMSGVGPQYKIAMSSSGFAANNVFSQTGGNGHE